MSSSKPPPPPGLHGLRVVAFESRRATEMGELIRRHGGEPVIAPALREVPLSENPAAFELLRRLEAGSVEILILLTGTGLRILCEAVAAEWPRERVAAALRRAILVARGPKPAAVLRQLGLEPHITIPEPNTWREILAIVDTRLPLAGKCVAVQEYGVPNRQLLEGLEARGATVLRVPVYRWSLPDDTGPLRRAVHALCEGTIAVAVFTSATQVHHLFQLAAETGDTNALRTALHQVVIGSIGPVCSEALRGYDLAPDLEPAHPKMGQLIGTLAERAREIFAGKRST